MGWEIYCEILNEFDYLYNNLVLTYDLSGISVVFLVNEALVTLLLLMHFSSIKQYFNIDKFNIDKIHLAFNISIEILLHL